MDHMEMAEKLREKANVGYEDAKAALEEANWDILDAMVILEKQGKVNPLTATYTTKQEPPEQEEYQTHQKGEGFLSMIGRFFKWLGKIIEKGNRNNFNVEKNGSTTVSIPVTAFALLLIIFPILPFTCFLLIVGLFCGYSYSFSGPDLGRDDVNNVMGKANKVADDIKDEFKSAANGGNNANSDDSK